MTHAFDAACARLAGPISSLGRAADDREAVARVVLGGVAEPGDGVLGRLVATVGAIEAAALLLDRPAACRLDRLLEQRGERVGPRTAQHAIERWLPRLDLNQIARSTEQAARVQARLIIPGDAGWPNGVDDLMHHAPLLLWVRGHAETLGASERAIALVGARASSSYGEHVAREAATVLSECGLTVVSGGAYGIDGAVHRAVLARGGTTIAFLAGGVDRFYPTGHDRLLTEITESGAVASELPCGAAPTRWRFLQRNRLIAASSAATVVLEAGRRSGSLNTAGHAAALGRPLGAVPGPVTSATSAGCHRLLREYDAICVVDAEQMAELVLGGPPVAAPAPIGDTSDMRRVRDALSVRQPRLVEDLVPRSGVEPHRVMGALGALEAEGRARRVARGWCAT